MNNFWQNKNVFITGITGFVGSNVANFLLESKANVTGLIRSINNTNNEDLLNKCNIYVGDICDQKLLCEIIAANEIDIVFHFAAYAIVRVSAKDPFNCYNINVMGTTNLLEACRNVGKCSKIIAASSDKSFGDHLILPYVETFPLQPKNTYDVAKAAMDMISRSYAYNYNLPICVTRASNIYGHGDYNFSRIIPNTIKRVLNGERPVLYSDIENMEREFIFIDDVVRAYDRIARHDYFAGEVYNIGGTGPQKINNIVNLICKKLNREDLTPEIIQRESNFKEIQKQHIDATKLYEATGWKPIVTLEQGIEKTVNWYKKVFK